MYVVLDTSVLIAAFLAPKGFAKDLIRLGHEADYLFCVSRSILNELAEKLKEKDTNSIEIDQFIDAISDLFFVCDEKTYTKAEIDADEHIVGSFNACKADLVVTNDRQLIKKLKSLKIPAVRPSQFKQYFHSEDK